MKTDLPDTPLHPPAKRRALEQAPDLWIAQWLAGDDLTPSERRRVEEVKARRRALVRDMRVGLVVGDAGVTPPQLLALADALGGSGATEIHHAGVTSRVHSACKAVGVPVVVHHGETLQHVVRVSDTVIAAPKETYEPERKTGVWDIIRYAKHRNLAVTIIMPDGEKR